MLSVSTDGVARHDQHVFWRETLCEYYFDVECAVPAPAVAGFNSRMDRITFGGLTVDRVQAEPSRAERTARLIRVCPSEHIQVSVLRSGRAVVVQDGRQAVLATPGDMAIVDTARPYVFAFERDSDQVNVHVLRDGLYARVPALSRMTAVTVPAGRGLGAIASPLLLALPDSGEDRDDTLAWSVARNAVDVAIGALLDHLGVSRTTPSTRSEVLLRAKRFMQDHLHVADLVPADVAAAVAVSERYLYVIFREADMTPRSWLREARLDRARALLADEPGFRDQPIQAISSAVGFAHTSHFCRAFKERYALTPREYRELHRS